MSLLRYRPVAGGVAIVVVAVCLAACGSTPPAPFAGSSASQSGPAPDACSLYRLEDAQKILGAGARQNTLATFARPSRQYSVSTCSYTAASGSGPGGFVSTTVFVQRARDAGQGKRDFLSVKQHSRGSQDMTGIGEMAYWNAAAGQLNVWKGNDWVIISAGRTGPRNMEIAKQIAAEMLLRD